MTVSFLGSFILLILIPLLNEYFKRKKHVSLSLLGLLLLVSLLLFFLFRNVVIGCGLQLPYRYKYDITVENAKLPKGVSIYMEDEKIITNNSTGGDTEILGYRIPEGKTTANLISLFGAKKLPEYIFERGLEIPESVPEDDTIKFYSILPYNYLELYVKYYVNPELEEIIEKSKDCDINYYSHSPVPHSYSIESVFGIIYFSSVVLIIAIEFNNKKYLRKNIVLLASFLGVSFSGYLIWGNVLINQQIRSIVILSLFTITHVLLLLSMQLRNKLLSVIRLCVIFCVILLWLSYLTTLGIQMFSRDYIFFSLSTDLKTVLSIIISIITYCSIALYLFPILF